MTESDFCASITASWRSICQLELESTFSNPTSVRINKEFRDVCLSPESTYLDVYYTGIRLSVYNFMLIDYSYFQFNYDKNNQLRYVFFPNPHIGGQLDKCIKAAEFHEYRDANAISEDEFTQKMGELKSNYTIPMIRYENSPREYSQFYHPCSHLHIGFHSSNRWAVRRIFTPHAFVLLILKHYYSERWFFNKHVADIEFLNRFEKELVAEKKKCQKLDSNFFSDNEDLTFYWG